MIAWILSNWQAVVLCILGVDAAILPLFPTSGVLIAIKNFLSGLAPKA
jgi:hypothetical protein